MTATDNTKAVKAARQRKVEILRFIKYCIVGVLNTLVCLGTIFVCKSLLGVNEYVSNAIGYAFGVINSFLWNRKWVFQSHGRLRRHAIVFLIGFGLCYFIQLGAIWLMMKTPLGPVEVNILGFVLSGYGIATIIGNVIYTVCNFLFNRLVTFR